MVDKVALRQVFSEYFGFPSQFAFTLLLHTHLQPRADTIGPLVAGVPNGLSLTLPHELKTKSRAMRKTTLVSQYMFMISHIRSEGITEEMAITENYIIIKAKLFLCLIN
jgi:hypothetical protein